MRNRPWLIFAGVFCWKIALFCFTAQPIPANDAFFYDGAVVHHLLSGGYYNPVLSYAYPISGTQIFSAYPPLYQAPLLAWMSVFGTSVLSAMALHLTLLGFYVLTLLAIFRRLQTPAWCVQFGGAFLLLLTFHDRPDTVAHLLGMLTVYAWVRSRPIMSGKAVYDRTARWTWLMVLFGTLTVCTSLQIGAVYLAWVWLGTIIACLLGRERFPFVPLLVNLLLPVLLLALVVKELPLAWAGFLENVHQTPFLTGLRLPYFGDLLKVIRTAPGVLLVALLLPWSWWKLRKDFASVPGLRHVILLLPVLLIGVGVSMASLCLVSPNTVSTIVCYLQPAVVAGYLALCGVLFTGECRLRAQLFFLTLAVLLGSVRLVGMSTWGVLCARDVSYAKAVARVRQELDRQPEGTEVVISSAFLYEAARHPNIHSVHSDWLEPAHRQANTDPHGLLTHRPAQLILTQFDYWRRYQALLEAAKSDPHLASIQIENTAGIRPPDSVKALQQVVQHVSWAPVIVNLTWR